MSTKQENLEDQESEQKNIEHQKRLLKLMLSAALQGTRKRLQLTQSEVAKKAGVTSRTICMLESRQGANCSMDTFAAVAAVLGMNVILESAHKVNAHLSRGKELHIPKRIVKPHKKAEDKVELPAP